MDCSLSIANRKEQIVNGFKIGTEWQRHIVNFIPRPSSIVNRKFGGLIMATEAQTCAIGILANRRNAQKSTGRHRHTLFEIPSITLFLCALVALWL